MHPYRPICIGIFLSIASIVVGQAEKASAYRILIADVERDRSVFCTKYAEADSTLREELVRAARTYVLNRITLDLVPSWYGTPWDFNGTTRTPGQGTIACGYFVNTVLLDAGFRLPRIKWSQQAAEVVVLKVSHSVKRFRDRPVPDVEAYLDTREDGLFLVGLDNHVGFIVKRGTRITFVHSSYYHPSIGVMSEPLAGNNPLARSRYRIVGELLGRSMIIAWITGTDLSHPLP